MTVKLIRMWSGEDVIADITKEDTDSITITDPIVAVPSQKQGQIAFCLLYTSPSPRDLSTSRMPSSA